MSLLVESVIKILLFFSIVFELSVMTMKPEAPSLGISKIVYSSSLNHYISDIIFLSLSCNMCNLRV